MDILDPLISRLTPAQLSVALLVVGALIGLLCSAILPVVLDLIVAVILAALAGAFVSNRVRVLDNPPPADH